MSKHNKKRSDDELFRKKLAGKVAAKAPGIDQNKIDHKIDTELLETAISLHKQRNGQPQQSNGSGAQMDRKRGYDNLSEHSNGNWQNYNGKSAKCNGNGGASPWTNDKNLPWNGQSNGHKR